MPQDDPRAPVAPPVEPAVEGASRGAVAPQPPDGRRSGPFLDVPGAAPATRSLAANWVFIGLVGFVAGQLAGYLLAVAAAAVAHQNLAAVAKLAAPPEWYIVSGLIGLWMGFAGAGVVASKMAGTGRLVDDLGLRFRPIDAAGVVIGVVAQGLAWLMVYPFRSHLSNYNAPVTKLTGGSHGDGGLLLISLCAVVGAPFFEEIFFRGVLMKALVRLFTPADGRPGRGRRWGVAGAVAVDGVVFGLAHYELEQLAALVLFGMALAAISYRTGRQGMNMVAHGSFNLVAVIAVLVPGGIVH